jgi:hypothetical protein
MVIQHPKLVVAECPLPRRLAARKNRCGRRENPRRRAELP